MSVAFKGIWFPIANNHHLQNLINDQPAHIQAVTVDTRTRPSKPDANRKLPVRFPVATDHPSQNPNAAQVSDGDWSLVNLETSSDNRSIRPYYRFPIGSQAKANLVDGYTQLITDRVRDGWSCHLVTILFSQLPGTRSTIINRIKEEVHRIYSTLLTRVHRKPRTASTDELPLLIGVLDLPVHKHNKLSGPMVLCNGGLHVHTLMLMPPTSRLKETLADHFRDKRSLYIGFGNSCQRIHVRRVVDNHERVVDYVLKTVLNGRLSYDDAVLVLPRSRGEL